jgi:Ca2+:H+ antiporter
VTSLARPRLEWLLVFVPVSLAGDLVFHQPLVTFGGSALSLVPLAALIGRSTDQLAVHAGPRLGGLLNATFGNLTELIVAALLVAADEFEVVKASLVGSIIGNLLLVLGFSFFVGGLGRKEQRFNAQAAGVHSASLMLAVTGLLIPALLVLTAGTGSFVEREVVSGTVAVVLIVLYGAALLFVQVTHAHLFRTPGEKEPAEWSARRAVLVLAVAAAFVGLESEVLVRSLEPAVHALGLSKTFVGLIVVAVVGNAAEHSAAVLFAHRDKLDVALEIAVGSSTQVAMFVAPVLVFVSVALQHPMDFVFTPFEVATVAMATLIVSLLLRDGRSNWLAGAQLTGAYLVIAVAAFFVITPGR